MPRRSHDGAGTNGTAVPAMTSIAGAVGMVSPAMQSIRCTRHGPASPPTKLNRRGMDGAALVMGSERPALEVQARCFLLVGLLHAHRVLLEGGLARIRVQQAQREAVHAVVEMEGDE